MIIMSRANGQKVEGHRVAVNRTSRALDAWSVVCTCGWTLGTVGQNEAIVIREGHLDESVADGAPLRGGGREAPSGPWKDPPRPRRDTPPTGDD